MYHVTCITSFERSEGVAALHHFVIMNMYVVKPQIEFKYQRRRSKEHSTDTCINKALRRKIRVKDKIKDDSFYCSAVPYVTKCSNR